MKEVNEMLEEKAIQEKERKEHFKHLASIAKLSKTGSFSGQKKILPSPKRSILFWRRYCPECSSKLKHHCGVKFGLPPFEYYIHYICSKCDYEWVDETFGGFF